jgi:hypothetical protein
MEYTFLPYVGLGNLRFDMTPIEVKNAIGRIPERDSPRSPATKTKNDYYVSLGLLVEFDDRDRCSSFTIMREGRLVFEGVDLRRLTYTELKEFLGTRGHQFVEEESGLKCDGLGLTSWRAEPDEESDTADGDDFDCLFIYRRGRDEYMKALIEAWE